MSNIRKKLNYHFKGFRKASIYMAIFCFVPILGEHIYQFIAPQEMYYKYESGNEVVIVKGNKVGENLVLHSNADWRRSIAMWWFDTLYCDGVKYPTQTWQDFMIPGEEDENIDWGYFKHTFVSKDRKCRVCGTMKGITSRGYEKPFEYCTKYFYIAK